MLDVYPATSANADKSGIQLRLVLGSKTKQGMKVAATDTVALMNPGLFIFII